MTDDPRMTRVGAFLRRTSLDELPQLWNVLRGEMSLVGPRPPLPREVAGYDIWHRRRLSMKPGITGLWQVRARRRADFDRWVELDLEYIDRWSLWLDIKIMLRTIPAVLGRQVISPRHAADLAPKVEPRDAWADEDWDGYCSVCERRVTFHAYGSWYRDQLVCTSCGSSRRAAALMLVLSIVRPDWRQARLWDIAPSGPASARLKRECELYLASHYRAGVPAGAIVDGTRNEDLERPSLPDGSMDVIVSSDVFEHVIDIDVALAQIARVLTPDGVHVWTLHPHLDSYLEAASPAWTCGPGIPRTGRSPR